MDEPGVIRSIIRIAPALALRGSIVRIWRGVGGQSLCRRKRLRHWLLGLLFLHAWLQVAHPLRSRQTFQRQSEGLTAGVGDVILRSESRESRPNVFGKADLFGRTRPAGFATIQFAGMQDGKVVLLRSGVITQSEATTMNSTGVLVSTRESAVYIPPSGSTQTSATQPTIPIIVDWKTTPAVPVLGKTIVIESASPIALIYRIEGP